MNGNLKGAWHKTTEADLPEDGLWVMARWDEGNGNVTEEMAQYHDGTDKTSDRLFGWRDRFDKLTPRSPDAWCHLNMQPNLGGYRHTPAMGEITGFGGGYERTCQDMLHAGVEWLMEHKDATIKLKGYKGIYGVAELVGEDNEPNELTEELEQAIMQACNNDCTGAMHQAVTTRLIYIHANGWDKYVDELTKKEQEK